jgi:hypothetical protein
VYATSPTRAVSAIAARTTGLTYGVLATAASKDGVAGYFKNTSTVPNNGVAVQGFSSGGGPAHVHPSGILPDAAGEFAGVNGIIGAATTGTGVIGLAGLGQYGVYGSSRHDTGSGAGVGGESKSPNGYGAFFTNYTTGIGLGAVAGPGYILDTHPNGAFLKAAAEFAGNNGVIGAASKNDGYGVIGLAIQDDTSTNSVVVYAKGPQYGTGLALQAVGNAVVSGHLSVVSLSKGSGTFKIDHPLDPENKYLSHSFVESPDMMNIYNGNVTTDERGDAVVELPTYFEALNRDPRYQLTVIGSFAAAQISREVSDNSFAIRTSEPGVKVSWQVTGIRQDAFAKAHPVLVEQEKELADRGRFLHPKELGMAASLGIGEALPQVASSAR